MVRFEELSAATVHPEDHPGERRVVGFHDGRDCSCNPDWRPRRAGRSGGRAIFQEAGTYHVIAISGGNIAILAGCLLVACRVLFVPWRAGLVTTILVLLAYAELAGGGSSSRAPRRWRWCPWVPRHRPAHVTPQAPCAYRVAGARGKPAGARQSGIPPHLLPRRSPLWSPSRPPRSPFSVAGWLRARVRIVGRIGSGRSRAAPARSPVLAGDRRGAAVQLRGRGWCPSCRSAAWRRWRSPQPSSLAHAAGCGWSPRHPRALVSSAALVHLTPWLAWHVQAPRCGWSPSTTWSWSPSSQCAYGCAGQSVAPRRSTRRGTAHGRQRGPRSCRAAAPFWQFCARLRVVVLDVGQGDATIVRFPSGRTLLVTPGARRHGTLRRRRTRRGPGAVAWICRRDGRGHARRRRPRGRRRRGARDVPAPVRSGKACRSRVTKR